MELPKINQEALQKGGLELFPFLTAIAELPYVQAIYLFGSRARGDHRQWSDIDLAVAYHDQSPLHRKVVEAIIEEVALVPYKIDVVDYHAPLADDFRTAMEQDKVLLYGE